MKYAIDVESIPVGDYPDAKEYSLENPKYQYTSFSAYKHVKIKDGKWYGLWRNSISAACDAVGAKSSIVGGAIVSSDFTPSCPYSDVNDQTTWLLTLYHN